MNSHSLKDWPQFASSTWQTFNFGQVGHRSVRQDVHQYSVEINIDSNVIEHHLDWRLVCGIFRNQIIMINNFIINKYHCLLALYRTISLALWCLRFVMRNNPCSKLVEKFYKLNCVIITTPTEHKTEQKSCLIINISYWLWQMSSTSRDVDVLLEKSWYLMWL